MENIDKIKRIDALKEILNRWGTLETQTAKRHLANYFNVNESLFNKSIYRDLNFLSDSGILSKSYSDKTGAYISSEEIEAGLVKSYKTLWTCIDKKIKIRGGYILEQYGGKIHCSPQIVDSISVSEVDKNQRPKERHLIFSVGNIVISLNIHSETFPLNIIFGRTSSFGYHEIENKYKRYICLDLPMTSISSRKEGILGHACVNLYNETEIRITDLSSSNGTFWTGLAEKEAYDFIDRLSEGRDTTLTKEYNSSVTMKKNLNRIDNEFNSIEYPVFIRLGTNTNFLLL